MSADLTIGVDCGLRPAVVACVPGPAPAWIALDALAAMPLDELARRLRRPEADARRVRDSAAALLTRLPKETTR